MGCSLALAGVNPIEAEESRSPLFKGIVAIGGLLIFFLSQRCFMIVGDCRKQAKEKHMKDAPEGHVHHHKKSQDDKVNLRSGNDDEGRPLSVEAEMGMDDRIPNDIALISLRTVGEVRDEKGGLQLESCIDQAVPIDKNQLGRDFGVGQDSGDGRHKSSHKDEKHDDHDHEHGDEDGHGHDHTVPTSVKSLMAMVILGEFLLFPISIALAVTFCQVQFVAVSF